MRKRLTGFTLIQLLCVIAAIAVLAALAYPAYRHHTRTAHLRAAHAVLLENARFMERFYRQKGTFKKNSTTWPDLPVSGNTHFCIRPNNSAKGAPDNQFTLKAVAIDKTDEARVLKINESLSTFICESSLSSCGDGNTYFNGKEDKECSLFQP